MRLAEFAKTCAGAEAYCIRAYAEALEVSTRLSGLLVLIVGVYERMPYYIAICLGLGCHCYATHL